MNKNRHDEQNRKFNPNDPNHDERKSPGSSDRDRMQDAKKSGDQNHKQESPPKH